MDTPRDSINSKLFVDNRNKFSITGVTRAISANQTAICVMVGKTAMTITGSMLHISKLDIDNGILEGDGWVDNIKYGKSAGVFKRIFK